MCIPRVSMIRQKKIVHFITHPQFLLHQSFFCCLDGKIQAHFTQGQKTAERAEEKREIRPHTPSSMPLLFLSCPKATSFPLSTMHGRKGPLSIFHFFAGRFGVDCPARLSERPSKDTQENSFWFLDGSGNSIDERSSGQQNGSGLLERQSLGCKESCLFLSFFSFFSISFSLYSFPLQGCPALCVRYLSIPSLT